MLELNYLTTVVCIKCKPILSQRQYRSHALRMPGNLGFGPLDENAATSGATTRSPSILYAGEIFTIGVLQFHINKIISDEYEPIQIHNLENTSCFMYLVE